MGSQPLNGALVQIYCDLGPVNCDTLIDVEYSSTSVGLVPTAYVVAADHEHESADSWMASPGGYTLFGVVMALVFLWGFSAVRR